MGNRNTNRNMVVQGSVLAVASMIARVIGMIYRIPLTNIIGDEGNGYYSCAFEVYSLMLLISSYSLPTAVAKMVSERLARGEVKNARRVYREAMVFAIIAGLICGLIIFFGADLIATDMMRNPLSAIALKVLAPTILIVAVMGVFRGYFQGMGTMMPTAISQIIEQIVNAVVSVAAAYYLFQYGKTIGDILYVEDYGAAYGAAGGTLGTGAGAVAGLLFLMFVGGLFRAVYKRQLKNDHSTHRESYSSILKPMIMIILPVLLSTTVYNISGIIDQAIFYRVMEKDAVANYVELWGIYSGKYKVLINVPIALASAITASLIPSMTAALQKRSRKLVNNKINVAMRFVMLLTIPCAVGLSILASPVLQMLFNDSGKLPASLLQVGAVAVIFYAMSTLTNGILQGLNRMNVPVINAVIALILHIICLYVMLEVFDLQLYAVVYANIFFSVVMCILNAIGIWKTVRYKQEVTKTFLIPVIASGIMGVVAFAGYQLLMAVFASNTIAVVCSILLAVVVYLVAILLLKGISREEMIQMPMGLRMAKLADKLHLFRE